MLFGATILALVLGTAVSARVPAPRNEGSRRGYTPNVRHQAGLNPLWQGGSSLTQGFLCDWCVVGVEDVQAAIRDNYDEILYALNRTANLCVFCPAPEQCGEYFLNDIPLEIDAILALTPDEICNEVGVCDENATLPGMVMNNLNGNRGIKRTLQRARIMQQKMIRLILGPDYLCTACQDFMTTARDMLLNNETQYEVMEFLLPLCDYMPSEYQADCDDFVASLPAMMTMLAEEVLVDSICTELGFCNKKPVAEPGLPDIFSQLGLPGILPVLGGGGQNQNPFQFPSGGNRQNPFQFPGQSRPNQNPFGLPSRPEQNPFGSPNRPGQTRPGQQNPYGFPSQPRPRPQNPIGKWPNTNGNSRPVKPQRPYYKPKPKTTPKPVEREIPGFKLEDIFGTNTGVLDRLPDIPQMPELRLPGLRVHIPGARGSQSRGNRGRHGRRQRSLSDWTDIEKLSEKFNLPGLVPMDKDKVLEYIPDPIPDEGITITEKGADEDCEVCKMAVTAVDTWLQENAPELQKMVSQIVQPFCQIFPSPMKEDCVSDVSEFVQTFITSLVSRLQPEPVCTWLGMCSSATEEVPFLPTMETRVEPGVEPTTWPLMP